MAFRSDPGHRSKQLPTSAAFFRAYGDLNDIFCHLPLVLLHVYIKGQVKMTRGSVPNTTTLTIWQTSTDNFDDWAAPDPERQFARPSQRQFFASPSSAVWNPRQDVFLPRAKCNFTYILQSGSCEHHGTRSHCIRGWEMGLALHGMRLTYSSQSTGLDFLQLPYPRTQ